tara:strand:+ start:185 stop:478 length:294 start_codon:yes stop_codon:yes gene_type:complete
MRVAPEYAPIGEALTIARGEANIGMYDARVSGQLNKIVELLESIPVPVVQDVDPDVEQFAEVAEAEAKRDYHIEDMIRTGLSLDQARAILCALEAYK